jgi:hypothetical protein
MVAGPTTETAANKSPCCPNPATSDRQVTFHVEHKDRVMQTWSKLLIAAPIATGLLAAPAAHADWHGHRGGWNNGYHGGYGYNGGGYYRHDNGNAAAAAVLGLGAAAIIGGVIASQQPRYYAPPPPVVYAPPPGYYPGYYPGY